ncbi:unnamed protein product, partial [Meganyctiphanes norvegica]
QTSAHIAKMNTALLLLGVLGTTLALPGNFSIDPRQVNFSIDPRQDDFGIQPRIPQFKLPALAPRNTLTCSKKTVKTTLAPGESAIIQTPNYPSDYDSKSKCKWLIKSSVDITITCSDFTLQSTNRKGKCSDALILDGTKFCGTSLTPYSGGTSIKAIFKSNKKKNYSGFSCYATADSGTTVSTELPGVGSGDCKCGQANQASRIVGGVETEVNEYPWQAAMIYSGYTQVFCGASVIGTKHVLTAAHCTQAVEDYGISYQVLTGAHGLTNAASSQLIFDADEYIQHSGYDSTTYDNDISIIVLSNAIDFTSSEIRPICLPDSDADAYDSVTATVSGWGTTSSGGSQPDVLMEVDVPTMSNSKCQSSYGSSITDNMLCAGYDAGEKDSCQGDSGGPLIYNPGNGHIQIGVVSWGYGCASAGYPGVYARVTQYLTWISDNTASSTTCPSA